MKNLRRKFYETRIGFLIVNLIATLIASPFIVIGFVGAFFYYVSKIFLIIGLFLMGYVKSAKVEASSWSIMVDVSDALKK